MKVLLFNGSCHKHGCTYTALNEVAKELNANGVETEILHIGTEPVQECIACGVCGRNGKCVVTDDVVARWLEKCADADGFVFGSPVYYSHPTGALLSAMDRMFCSSSSLFRHKVGAVVVSARRAGTSSSLDVLSKHLTIASMVIPGSSYWNMVHGARAEDVLADAEGVQTMHNLGRNMAWLLKCIELGKSNGLTAPELESGARTNFVR